MYIICLLLISSLFQVPTTIVAQEACGLGFDPIGSLTFIYIGLYEGIDTCGRTYTKEYFIPRFFKAYWHQVKAICEAHGLGISSLETKEESDYLLKLLELQTSQKSHNFYIGGMALKAGSKNDWYWINSGAKISYDLYWKTGNPDGFTQPGWGAERCLSIAKDPKNERRYNDVFCDPYLPDKFVCETFKFKNDEEQSIEIK